MLNNVAGAGTVTETVIAVPVASLKVTAVEPALLPVNTNFPSAAEVVGVADTTSALLLNAV